MELKKNDFSPSSCNIYEVNIRQYTDEGNFRAFMAHIPRLASMGVEILWLMPIHPIGLMHRKGCLGSYYSISDFKGLNPEFGGKEDFGALVREAHRCGMKVLLDWVANHAAWDNVWTAAHPEYFARNEEGDFLSPYDWTDVIQIDHASAAQREAMIDAMEYWVTEFDIDGFRADLAHLTPLDFWLQARKELNLQKQGLIWLAETEDPNYHQAFDISFTWEWMHKLEKVCQHQLETVELVRVLENYRHNFPQASLRMFFTSNHDENSWNGTEFEKYGAYVSAATVFNCLFSSVPLIYSGQEIPNRKRLSFFDKDRLLWDRPLEMQDFYARLLNIRRTHPALWDNRSCGMPEVFLIEGKVIAFFREAGHDLVFTAMNFGNSHVCTQFIHVLLQGGFLMEFHETKCQLNGSFELNLAPGEFVILTKG